MGSYPDPHELSQHTLVRRPLLILSSHLHPCLQRQFLVKLRTYIHTYMSSPYVLSIIQFPHSSILMPDNNNIMMNTNYNAPHYSVFPSLCYFLYVRPKHSTQNITLYSLNLQSSFRESGQVSQPYETCSIMFYVLRPLYFQIKTETQISLNCSVAYILRI
jgi:hypothetical protein